MYTPSWLSDQSLITSLLQEPWRWQAAQALRVLGQIPQPIDHRGDGRAQVSLRFACDPAYRFPCGELYQVCRVASGWRLLSTQPALHGYYGTLPYVYQDLEKQMRLSGGRGDTSESISGFFSLFNDQILRHTSQITLDSSLSVLFEQKPGSAQSPRQRLLALGGLPSPKTIPVNNLVRYIAVIGRKTSNLKLLSLILEDYFSLKFRLESPSPMRIPVAPDCRTQLHSRVGYRSRCVGRLGASCLLGHSGYLLYTCVYVVIVINTGAEYQTITRDRQLAPAIMEMCGIYFANLVRFRLQINCPRHCLSAPQLSARPAVHTARLGRLSCLLSELYPEQRVTVDFPEHQISKWGSRFF
ncbi:type VI secretion system baseplate subunit TssG [Endozoicomonas acroporae]|uniref:type VI secretion system baseplate subunit TssG n=1 Tax=Endozoicomonas acroporae TaxID=1701104 RepID=UPI003D78FFD8